MTKKELIKKLAETTKNSITKTEEFCNSFENTLIEAITSNEEVVLSPQLSKFILKSKKARLGKMRCSKTLDNFLLFKNSLRLT
ncbi:MAG: HU family DNA-binding protein [Candidatus Phytoplasma sp. TWB_XP]